MASSNIIKTYVIYFFKFSSFMMFFLFSLQITSLAQIKENLDYLGYSKDMQKFAESVVSCCGTNSQQSENKSEKKETKLFSEADSVQEQLTELAKTRGISSHNNFHTEKLKTAIQEYWKKQNTKGYYEPIVMSEELKKQLIDKIKQSLENHGYKIKKIELIDAPASLGVPQARLIVRVVKPLKTKNHYKEIQNNLLEIKQLCIQAATIDGIKYIRELTTFIAENPKNNYYYEKTILTNN